MGGMKQLLLDIAHAQAPTLDNFVPGRNGELVAAWNFMQTLKAGDYIEIMYSASDTSVQILAQAAAAPVPGIPSMILTVAQIK